MKTKLELSGPSSQKDERERDGTHPLPLAVDQKLLREYARQKSLYAEMGPNTIWHFRSDARGQRGLVHWIRFILDMNGTRVFAPFLFIRHSCNNGAEH